MSRFAVPAPTSDGLLIVETLERCVIARLACRSLRDAEAQQVLTHLAATVGQAHGRLIVSFECVNALSLNAARGLVSLASRCDAFGGRLVVLGVERDEARLIRSLGGRSVRFARNLRGALSAFGARRTPHHRREKAAA